MRIALPVHSFEPGGGERVALRLAAEWQAAGHEVTVVLGRDRGVCASTAPDLDYRTSREPFATDRWETLWMMICLARFLRRERVDALFCPGNTYTVVCVVMRLLFPRRCPAVLVKISNDLERPDLPPFARPLYRLWLRVQGRLLDRFVALAEPMKPEIVETMRVSAASVAVIPDPALLRIEWQRLGAIDEGDAPAGRGTRYLSVGRLVAQKNYALLLRAFAASRSPDDRLVIAGEGSLLRRLVSLRDDLGLTNLVEFPGHVSDVEALYRDADVFVLSSDYEGIPAVAIEALAAGLPIATTRSSAGMDWLTGYGRFGEVVPQRNPDALGDAMRRMASIFPDRQAMREQAQAFTLERASGAYLDEFETMQSASNGRRAEFLSPDGAGLFSTRRLATKPSMRECE
ncbi:glycosyltransferase [Tsuneonella sp. YG55]|uniref:Glycosyltransferase n=1 Tax=Tsuneonella litorea TaxID=2976475 RepID=A0A9X3AM72_9SPHN|nr:glycosyltransferase [Tsuneonella litorea]MCT2560193.1 glycosyltransferase [Tsuneonella litorea]